MQHLAIFLSPSRTPWVLGAVWGGCKGTHPLPLPLWPREDSIPSTHLFVLTPPCPARWTALLEFTNVLFAMEFLEQKKWFLYLGNGAGKGTPWPPILPPPV